MEKKKIFGLLCRYISHDFLASFFIHFIGKKDFENLWKFAKIFAIFCDSTRFAPLQ